ncbi:MAG TPA: hypothetical protein VNQ79_17335 [Blastocatellia bacterium]|nr:hypothetical protein [Blastocatellia bacterium]
MRRGRHFMLLTAILISTLAVVLTVTAFIRPCPLPGWLVSLTRSICGGAVSSLKAEVVDRMRPRVLRTASANRTMNRSRTRPTHPARSRGVLVLRAITLPQKIVSLVAVRLE